MNEGRINAAPKMYMHGEHVSSLYRVAKCEKSSCVCVCVCVEDVDPIFHGADGRERGYCIVPASTQYMCFPGRRCMVTPPPFTC